MSIYPANLVELMDLFPTEESCLEYLSLIRWPDGYGVANINTANGPFRQNPGRPSSWCLALA